MNRPILAQLALLLAAAVPLSSSADDSFRLHNGWRVSPAGKHEPPAAMLLGSALSPDGRWLALTSAGYNEHKLYLVEVETGRIRQQLPLDRTWNGLAWSSDGSTIYAAGGASPRVHIVR